jgi:hypothetical protein
MKEVEFHRQKWGFKDGSRDLTIDKMGFNQ